jgi:hypothetical protein
MATVQNISSEDLEVTCLRRVVKAGETVQDVDDALVDPANQLWSPAIWLVNGKEQDTPEPPAVAEEPTPTEPAPAAPEVTE